MTLELITSVITVLNSEQSVTISGFVNGFLYDFKFNTKTLQNPFATIFNASISGFITSIGAGIVGGFVPEELKFLIPLSAIASCVYYKYNDLKESKSPKSCMNKQSYHCCNCRCRQSSELSKRDSDTEKHIV